jgi:hypothetical protein
MTPPAPPTTIMVSPQLVAHLQDCPHKDDDDWSGWGRIVDVPRAWQRIATGEKIATNAGAKHGLIPNRRCITCEDSN